MTHAMTAQDSLLDPKDAFTDPLHHKTYLIDGQLKAWNGAMAQVYSPIRTLVNGVEKPVLLGSAPELKEQQGLEALACSPQSL